MKIATWNIQRLKHKSQLLNIINEIKVIDADILVLTEYDTKLSLDNYPYSVFTNPVANPLFGEKPTERRVALFSKYPIKKKITTYNNEVSCAAVIETSNGDLLVYGTIVGLVGNRSKEFIEELNLQMLDLVRISKAGNLCYLGDINMSFSDSYYYTKKGRDLFLKSFEDLDLDLVSQSLPEAVDHIVLSKNLTHDKPFILDEWNLNKHLSDHKGIAVSF